METKTLEQLRSQGMRTLGLLALLNAVILTSVAAVMDQTLLAGLIVLLSIAPVAVALSNKTELAQRVIMGVTFPVYAGLACAIAKGTMWQMDMHLVFFCYLAALGLLADWRVIATAAAVTAVHHLSFNILMPELIFAQGSDYLRVLFHAFLVIIAGGALGILCVRISSLVDGLNEAERLRASSEAANAKEQQERLRAQRETIASLTEGLEQLAKGNFAHRIAPDKGQSDDHKNLRIAFNGSVEKLASTIGEVRESADAVNTGSREIMASSEDSAIRNERQSANLEETATSMREVTELVKSTATRAQDARSSMGETNERAIRGGEIVKRAVQAMSSIEDSSGEITQIINVIDGIAFQTNLLALNAGVEAARAGDAGKGFAVVANEVRALAQRSAEAAQDIKQLIGKSTAFVEDGVKQVADTGDLLQAIVDQIGNVTGQVEDIAQMATTQATSLEQVNSSVAQMDTMTQQNAAMVEETTAASRSLSDEAARLTDLVSRFKVSQANSLAAGGKKRPAAPVARPRINAQVSAPLATTPANKAATALVPAETVGNLALKPQVEDDPQDWSEF